MKWQYIVFGAISILVLCWITFTQVKCNKLQKQLNAEKIKNIEYVDSLTYINREHENKIKTYELEISELKNSVDSLNKVKQKVIIKKDEVIISENVSSAVKLLKQNLSTWNE